MQKIILASASSHRRKLLKLFGLSFTVQPSKIKEVTRIKTTCADLVKENAALKARDVARGIKQGIVIGADTLVLTGRKTIIGKPRSLKEAKRILKILARRPAWVYTGLAIVDAERRRVVTDYERTKIFMERLSSQEINRYYRHVNPLDKAGGFDIEGKGGVWIRRIEGCYFNVVGLPLSKLYRMLKKFGISIAIVLMAVYGAGCATEYNLATQQQETTFTSTEKEIKIGEAIAREFDKEFKMVTDVDVNERISKIAKRIFDVSDRKELVYSIKIIDDDKVNAVSLPGGFLYVFKGLVDNAENDDQIACVIGHELGHVTARHSVKKMEGLYGYNFLMILAASSRNANLAQGVNLALASIFTEYSREDEFFADKLGVKYAKKAGFDPAAMAGFLKKLQQIEAKEPKQQFNYWRTHPYIPQRIAAVNKEITGQLKFKDYLNLTGEQ